MGCPPPDLLIYRYTIYEHNTLDLLPGSQNREVMRKLRTVDEEALKSAFQSARHPKAVKRLMVAIAYLDGVSVDALSARYGIPRSTIYTWLDRFETESIEKAVQDGRRSGRPAELEPREFVQLASDIADGPRAHGFSDTEWTANLLQTHISAVYGVDYSEGHVRRLLRQLGPESVEDPAFI